jgi:hypothetical protein
VNRGKKQRMEELTGVARSAEAKQRQQNRVVRVTFFGGGRWLGKMVGTRAVVGAASTEHVDGPWRLGGGR